MAQAYYYIWDIVSHNKKFCGGPGGTYRVFQKNPLANEPPEAPRSGYKKNKQIIDH